MADFSFDECLKAADTTLLDGFSGLSEQDSNSSMGFDQNMTLGRQSMHQSNSTDELQALFPMLHETSLECMNDTEEITSSSSCSSSSSSLLSSINVPFEHDFSPILKGNHAPELFQLIDDDGLSLDKPIQAVPVESTTVKKEVELKEISFPWWSNAVPKSSSTSLSSSSKKAKAVPEPVKQEEMYVDDFGSDMMTTEPDVAEKWNAAEQHAFFSSMKTKWQQSTSSMNNLNEGYATMRNHQSMLLAMRFQAISTKLKTKNFEEVREFYHYALDQITKILAHVEHDVDLTNLDEIRIALWCWFKHLNAKGNGSNKSYSLEDKAQLSLTLLGSIQRSRRQMLKAKAVVATSASSATPNTSSVTTTTSNFSQSSKVQSPTQHQQVHSQKSSSSKIGLSMTPGKMSFMKKSSASSTPQHQSTKPASSATVHLPMVRKKRPFASSNHQHGHLHHQGPSHQQHHRHLHGGGHKSVVKSLNAIGLFDVMNGEEETPKKQKRLEDHHEPSDMLVSPAASGILSSGNMSLINFQTPLSSKKKMSILVRLVPADDITKAYAVQCGHNPKVEVKMRSTKKISDVVEHMVKKWAVIRHLVPPQAQLRFYPKQDKAQPTNPFHAGWGSEDVGITCFDILKYCGKKSPNNNENIVNLMYQWTDRIPLRQPSAKTVVSEAKTPAASSSSSSFGLKTPYCTTSANTMLNFTPSSALSLSPLVLTGGSSVSVPPSSGNMKSATKRTPTCRRMKKKKEETVVVTKRATLVESKQQQHNETLMMTTGKCMTLPISDKQVAEGDSCNPHEDVLSSEWDFEGDAGLDTSFLDDSPECMWDLMDTEEPQPLQHDEKLMQGLEMKSRRRITPMLVAPQESCSL